MRIAYVFFSDICLCDKSFDIPKVQAPPPEERHLQDWGGASQTWLFEHAGEHIAETFYFVLI